MKSNISNTWTTILVTAITAAALTIAAEAQIYLSHSVTGVGRYDVYSGAEDGGWPWWTMSTPSAIFVSGSDLFIADRSSSSVYKYDANTGTNTGSGSVSGVGGSFISDPTLFPSALAMIGNNLLVGDELSGTIRKYNASTGDLVDGAFITDLAPTGMGFALNGSDLFVIINPATK